MPRQPPVLITINVSGRKFEIELRKLKKYPTTLLGNRLPFFLIVSFLVILKNRIFQNLPPALDFQLGKLKATNDGRTSRNHKTYKFDH